MTRSPYPVRSTVLAAVLALMCAALHTTQAYAQASSAMMLLPFPKDKPLDGKVLSTYIPSQTDGPGTPDLNASLFALDARLRPVQDERAFTIGTEIRHVDLDTNDPALPTRLVRTELAAGMQFGTFDAFDTTWRPGATAGAGFASSNAFHDGQAWYGLASLYASTRLSERAGLTLGLDYDGNRAIFPDAVLPILLYNIRLDEQLQLSLGFPINGLVWTPDKKFSLTVYLIGLIPEVEAVYKISDQFSVFGALLSTNDAFHVADESEGERLFFSGNRVEAGARYGFTNGITFEGAVGIAFNQEFETGTDIRDLDTVRELDDAPYFRVGASYAF